MTYRLLSLFILSVFFLRCPVYVQAQSISPEEPSEEALAAINNAIAEVKAEISHRSSERSSFYQELEKFEKELLSVSLEIGNVENSIIENESVLDQLQIQNLALLTKKNEQQEIIRQYLRSAYQTGRQEYFKLLLNQEDPVLASRTLRYYRYFNEARSKRVEQYTDTLRELGAIENQISETTLTLNEKQEALRRQQTAMQYNLNERQTVLDELDILLSGNSQKLEALEAEKTEMELLIDELRRSIANMVPGDQQQPFFDLKGKLPWPVDGAIQNHWGSSYGLGDLSWEGITINADDGAEIRAIHRGRVVFSDWFSSSGLLLIIDHGDGYMSLYAHNQELYKEVGEWVNGGDIIAAVGNTGGQTEYGLYFEIRQNGESQNPSLWCSEDV